MENREKENRDDLISSLKLQMLELQSKGESFLYLSYQEANGSAEVMLSFRELVEQLGWNKNEFDPIEDYLAGKRLIKRMTMGGIDGAFQLTPRAVRTIENSILREEPSFPRPSSQRNIQAAQDMNSSQQNDEYSAHSLDSVQKKDKSEQQQSLYERGLKEEPWLQIPNIDWHREAVRLLWEGYQSPEIGRNLSLSSKTIDNALSMLRKQYPNQVPSRATLREMRRS